MKKLLFGLGASLLASTAAHAQQNPYALQNPYTQPPTLQLPQNYVFVVSALPTVAAATGLEAVAGKPDVFTLKRGRYDEKELLETLAAKAGGKAIFVDKFQTQPLPLRASLQGTAAELIEKLRDYGVVAGKLGADWVFLSGDKIPTRSELPPLFRADSKTPNLRYYLRPDRGIPVLPGRRVPVLPTPKNDPNFNIKPNPGQNLSPQATPFSFNGNRLYHVPLQPTQK